MTRSGRSRTIYRSIVTALIMCLMLIYSARARAVQAKAPFIYYYSQDKSAFIVERADGSESRVLATYTLHPTPDIDEHIIGLGWSPSGKWFAWSSQLEAGSGGKHNVFLVTREGGASIKVFPTDLNVKNMKWSPTADLLLVDYYIDDGNWVGSALIYDPTQQRVIAQLSAATVDGVAQETWFRTITWSPDGQLVALNTMRGKTAILQIKTNFNRVISTEGEAEWPCTDFGTLPQWLKDHRLAYRTADNAALVVENVDSHNQVIYPFPKGKIGSVDWSPDEKSALIYVQPEAGKYKFNLWLLSVANKSLELISDNVFFDTNCNIPFNKTAWSRKDQGVFLSDNRQPWIVSLSPMRLMTIMLPSTFEVRSLSPMIWQADGTLAFVTSGTNGDRIYAYEPQKHSLKQLAPLSDGKDSIGVSSFDILGDSYLAYGGGQACVIDLQASKQICVDFLAKPKYGSISADKLMWHPTEKWLFLVSENVEYQYLINVMNADGTSQRSLARCTLDSASCFGWLPESN